MADQPSFIDNLLAGQYQNIGIGLMATGNTMETISVVVSTHKAKEGKEPSKVLTYVFWGGFIIALVGDVLAIAPIINGLLKPKATT